MSPSPDLGKRCMHGSQCGTLKVLSHLQAVLIKAGITPRNVYALILIKQSVAHLPG